ncbi:Proto-oncogene tyrosine-protein kinase ROS [Camponotus floridanus]|uniref:Proto-oncogene tyrosine-protein kinase ROS n=1 Tax=Camponotus floridanus TaxID=104421 RepID=E2AM96_CAMFO|nr:Proto-oncogene tyrosine-protein kinase ROS [Camponotus floridanus]
MKDISLSKKSDHHILNFKSDRSHSDNTVRNEREVDEVPFANISIIPESIESSLSKPTSLRAFVQFDSQFTQKVNDIFVTLRWNQSGFTDEIIQEYQVQCSFFEDFRETCDDKNNTTTKLEHTVHNLTSNTTYYFRVRAHSKIVAGPYTDLINVSTTHENPIPKLLVTSNKGIHILDVDLNYITDWFLDLNITIIDFLMFGFDASIAVVHWMPPKELNCVAVTYKVHWKSVTLVNDTQQKGKQFINVPKRTADGRFFTKINLSLPVQDYLIYVRVYPIPNNFSDFYNKSLRKTVHKYSEPNNIK